MFQIVDNKVFMDSVHGYISVPRCFVKHIIDTKVFQRLRNIDQTGMRILYPAAKHDRFGHSLGVYYLGCKAVDALLNNFSKDMYWNIQSDHKAVLFWAKNKLLFMLACLLHDIGHVPFSHSLESEVIKNSISDKNNLEFKQRLAELINARENDNAEKVCAGDILSAEHEQIGARYILEFFSDNIAAIYDDLIEEKYPNIGAEGVLYSENYDGQILLNKDTFDQDICFIVRMILGLKYMDYSPEKQIKNCFIELLNSDNFDVDKLDYIIRDTRMSGIANINVDVERLLGAIIIVTKTVYENGNNFCKDLSDDTIYELDTNDREKDDDKQSVAQEEKICISGMVKGTIKLYSNAQVRIKKGSKFERLADENAKAMIISDIDTTYFSKDTQIYQDGNRVPEYEGKIPLQYKEHKKYQCVIMHAEIIEDRDFLFTVREGTMDLCLNGYCEIEIAGKCGLKEVLTTIGLVKITGAFKKLELLGNKLQDCIPNKNAYNEFSVGYTKQAMNVIANVLEARDYLYLWVYAHHKVTYYANYLIPILTRNVLSKRRKQVTWSLDYNQLDNLDDYYVWTEIKKWSSGKIKTKEKELCDELFNRKYKYSVYKSLAEFDLLFQNFSDTDKMNIHNWFREKIVKDSTCLDNNAGETTAGYLKENIIKEIKRFADKKGLKNVKNIEGIVFVEATYKTKTINPHNILIVIGNKVVVMEKIPFVKGKSSLMPKSTAHYFYLYYTVKQESTTDISIITQEIKELLQLYSADHIQK